jgi:hypothetical protein
MVRAIAPFYRLGAPIRWMLSATSATGVASLVDPACAGPEEAPREDPKATACGGPAALGSLP